MDAVSGFGHEFYTYTAQLGYDSGSWKLSNTTSFDAPYIKARYAYSGKISTGPVNFRPDQLRTEQSSWSGAVALVQSALNPGVQLQLSPPKVLVDNPALEAQIYFSFSAADNEPQFETDPSKWKFTFDLGKWLDRVKITPLESEAIGEYGYILSNYISGRVKSQLEDLQIVAEVDLKDEAIASTYVISFTLMMSVVVHRVLIRPTL